MLIVFFVWTGFGGKRSAVWVDFLFESIFNVRIYRSKCEVRTV